MSSPWDNLPDSSSLDPEELDKIKNWAFGALMITLFSIFYSAVILLKIILFFVENYIKRKQIAKHQQRQHALDFSAFNTDTIQHAIERELEGNELYWCDVPVAETELTGIMLMIIFATIGICAFIITLGATSTRAFILLTTGLNVGLALPILVALDFFAALRAIFSNRPFEAIYVLSSAGAHTIRLGGCGVSSGVVPYEEMEFCEASGTNVFFTKANPRSDSNFNKRGFQHIYNVDLPTQIITAKMNEDDVVALSLDNFINFQHEANPLYSQVPVKEDIHRQSHNIPPHAHQPSNNQNYPPPPPAIHEPPRTTLQNYPAQPSHGPVMVVAPPPLAEYTLFIQQEGKMLGFVKITDRSTVATLREIAATDELPLPLNFTVLNANVPITKKQETKVTAKECATVVDGRLVLTIVALPTQSIDLV